MSRFFFHLRGGGLSLKDEIGTECRDAEEARSFALQVVEDLRSDERVPRLSDQRAARR